VNGDLDPTVTNSGWHSQNRSFVFGEDLSGYMQTSGLEYDGDKISGYMGSAFKAGDELPQSVTDAADYVSATSGNIDATIENVSSNSGAWGGSALPISARDGLDLEMSGGMLWIGASALNETLSGKQDTLTFAYNENDAISAINGSALAGGGGGGDVPEGVMSESGLEYNAVNEISGYNGSAIAQYGAEKQWLGHDDTLVHASNSAQYALGVNLSAVAQLLGVDETVLYTGNTNVTAFTASEPFTNFREVVFYVSPNDTLPATKVALPIVGYNTSSLALTYNSIWAGFKGGIQISTEYTNTGMSAFQVTGGAWFGWAGTAVQTGTYQDACIYKIIGIGRKS
jgi:hypothetical protein